MSRNIAIVTSALLLAVGAAGAASATEDKKPIHHPRSHVSLQCSAEADAKGLHGEARAAFRHDCLKRHEAALRHRHIVKTEKPEHHSAVRDEKAKRA